MSHFLMQLLHGECLENSCLRRLFLRVVVPHIYAKDMEDNFVASNLGYVPLSRDDDTSGIVKEARNGTSLEVHLETNHRMYAKLLLQCSSLEKKAIIEIGCGRGTCCEVLQAYFNEFGTYRGIDLIESVVQQCRRNFSSDTRCSFMVGSAETTGLASKSADVVLNLESSHLYPDFRAFIYEVARILKFGGHFVWADHRGVNSWDRLVSIIDDVGFKMLQCHDITQNVLKANADTKMLNHFRSGYYTYKLYVFTLQKL